MNTSMQDKVALLLDELGEKSAKEIEKATSQLLIDLIGLLRNLDTKYDEIIKALDYIARK